MRGILSATLLSKKNTFFEKGIASGNTLSTPVRVDGSKPPQRVTFAEAKKRTMGRRRDVSVPPPSFDIKAEHALN